MMPFSRPRCTKAVYHMLRGQGVTWIPIVQPHAAFVFPDEPWVQPLVTTVPPGWDGCYWKLNAGLRITDQLDFVHFLCDDDVVQPDFYERMRGSLCRVHISSGHRADFPRVGHGKPGLTLAAKENLLPELTGAGQYVVPGWMYAELDFPNSPGGDFFMLQQLARRFPFEFHPDAVCYNNLLEPKAWIKEQRDEWCRALMEEAHL